MPVPPRNLISDVAGIRVGNAADRRRRSGVSVVLFDRPAIAAAAVQGGAPGTREIDVLAPENLVSHVDAIVLAGGSVFGLAAADGAVAWLARRRRGLSVGRARVPIVPAAILFDLRDRAGRSRRPPLDYRALGESATAAAARSFALGSVGAGMGAMAGRRKGGLGSASFRTADGFTIGALAAVNCYGETTIGDTDCFWAAPLEQGREFGGRGWPTARRQLDLERPPAKQPKIGANTTIAVVATDAKLDKPACRRLALMAHDGIARAVRPAHTPFDGDTVFAAATGKRAIAGARDLARLGGLAADCLARAIARAVFLAERG